MENKKRQKRTLYPEERQRIIIALLEQHGSVNVKDLAENFELSEVTVRNDLINLEKSHQLIRTHGGAIRNNIPLYPSWEERLNTNKEEKERIARAALQFIHSGERFFLDSGTTINELVMCLPDIDNLEIITSDLNVAANASLLPNIAITIIGGRLRGGLELYGPDTIKYIKSCKFVDKYFMSVFGVSIKHGLTTNLPSNTMKKKAMMDIANETILLADSSKFDVNEGHWIADIKDLDKIITAKAVPQYIIKEIKELGIDVLQV